MSVTLPTPDPAAKALSNELLSRIKNEIAQKGEMSFERYMSMALYEPGLGYYRNGTQKFGEAGDFVTAPEISPLFSQCLANQCADVLANLKGGDILEFGAGRGTMAADILLQLEKSNQLPAHYYILEISGQLQNVQKETIAKKAPHLASKVQWLSTLPEKPIKGVVLANEVLDAMPATLFTWDGEKPLECGVTIENDSLTPCLLKAKNDELEKQLKGISLEKGYTSEVNLHISGWIAALSDVLAQGAVYLIDYGFLQHEYYHPDRNQGTLMCHYKHLTHPDPFVLPGLQDITAHVDFTAVGDAAEKAGFEVASFSNQANFLMESGLLSLLEETQDEAVRFSQNQAILKLTMPSEMGELFKVMVLNKK